MCVVVISSVTLCRFQPSYDGASTMQVAQVLSEVAPIQLLRFSSFPPWRGGFLSLNGVIERLRQVLPPTFEDLDCEFAVGVVTADGRHVLIDSGPLPEAVAASAAIPFVFEHVHVPGRWCEVCMRISLKGLHLTASFHQLAPGLQIFGAKGVRVP